jgi:hypothetical protein
MAGYFMTEDQEKLARYETHQRGLKLQSHLATLKAEIGEHVRAWRRLGDRSGSRDLEINSFKVGEDKVTVLRPQPHQRPMPGQAPIVDQIEAVSWAYFDRESIARLYGDLEETKRSLEEVSAQCTAMGTPLP